MEGMEMMHGEVSVAAPGEESSRAEGFSFSILVLFSDYVVI